MSKGTKVQYQQTSLRKQATKKPQTRKSKLSKGNAPPKQMKENKN